MAFWRLTVPTAPEVSEGLTNFLWEQGALGVVEEEEPPGIARLVAFFPEAASPAELLQRLSTYRRGLGELGFSETGEASVTPEEDHAWATAWRDAFTPLAVGARLLVVPPWETEAARAESARTVVVIEPGRAFGTGHHGSTAGCLRLLEDAIARRPAHALDLGTGTGILAVAAVRLGVPSVLAIDVDPDAIAAARANAAANAASDRIEVLLGGPEVLDGRRFPLVLANLLTEAHVGFAARYARLLEPGGTLIVGGILSDEGPRVVAALSDAGLAPAGRLDVDGWCALVAQSADS
jgi:ribosomal protein L11 methyltransferase